MATIAYCDPRGVIEYAHNCPVPDWGLPVYRARTQKQCFDKMSAVARHAYDGKTLLVPGIPEALDDDHALEALQLFRAWLDGEKSVEIDARRKAWTDRLCEAMST